MKPSYQNVGPFKKVIIRSLRNSDLPQLHNFINTISLEKAYTLFQGEYISFEEEIIFVDQTLENIKKNQEIFFVMYSDKKLVGIASLEKKALAENHTAKLGIIIDQEHRGYGLGKILLKELIKQAKAVLKCKIITAELFAANDRALSLYSSLGFKQYGSLPAGLKYKNKYHDCLLMYKNIR